MRKLSIDRLAYSLGQGIFGVGLLCTLAVFPSCHHSDESKPTVGEPVPSPSSPSVPQSLAVRRAAFVAAAQAGASDDIHSLAQDRESPGIYHGYNPHQRMTAAFTSSGVRVSHGHLDRTYSTSLQLMNVTCGSDDAAPALPSAAPSARQNRVELQRGNVTEWYVNGPLGIEQGFDLAAPPTCSDKTATGQVEIDLLVESSLPAEFVDNDGDQAIEFRLGKKAVLRYSDLYARDAEGKTLPARMSLSGKKLALHIDAKDAHFPISVDPLIGVAKAEIIPFKFSGGMTVSDAEAGSNFGTAVTIDGTTAAGSAPRHTEGGQSDAGAVYIYEGSFSTGGYTFVQKLTAPTPGKGGLFGQSISLSGDILVVGEPATGTGGSGAGKIYVYVRTSGIWPTTPTFSFGPSDGTTANGTGFGAAVDIQGRTIFIGAPNWVNGGGKAVGKVFIFDDTNADGTFTKKDFQLTTLASPALTAAAGDTYGAAVAVYGNIGLVGAPNTDPAGMSNAGVVEEFTATTTAGMDKNWVYQTTIVSTTAAANNTFGFAVDITATRALIGAPTEQVSKPSDGSATVYNISGTTLTREERMSRGVANDTNGFSVALSDTVDGALVGAKFATSPTGKSNVGSAYIFDRSKADATIPVTMWGFSDDTGSTDVPSAFAEAANDLFGWSVAVTGNVGVIGAPQRDLAKGANEGAIYLYTIVKQQGDTCTSDIQCATGFCIDGYCCNTVCGRVTAGVDNDNDCSVCSMAKGATTNGTCGFRATGSSCGSAVNDSCTSPDTCSAAGVCNPNNQVDGTACGDTTTNTTCNAPDSCMAGVCNSNYASAATTCKAAGTNATCDPADMCDGAGSCVTNLASFGTSCGNTTATACHDPDVCNGVGACLTNNRPSGTICAPAGTGADATCDPADTCDGSGTCTVNQASNGTACGDTATNTTCNAPDSCMAGKCNSNFALSSVMCKAAGTNATCDPADFCDGSGGCATTLAARGTACGSATATACSDADSCDGAGACSPNNKPMGTICAAAAAGADATCDPADTCDAAGACTVNVASNGTACGDTTTNTTCNAPDSCQAGKCNSNFALSSVMCKAAGTNATCDPADFCDGSGSCPATVAVRGTACGSNAVTACSDADSCDGTGTCSLNNKPMGTICAAAAAGADATCDPADTCDAAGSCTVNMASNGTACGDTTTNTTCNAADSCQAGKCNANLAPTTTMCAAAGADAVCDPADFCSGTGLCVPTFASVGTACGSSTVTACSLADSCNGIGACSPNNLPSGTICASAGASSICDPADLCDAAGACVTNMASAGTPCGTADPTAACDLDDTCNATGACVDRVKPVDATSPCRAAVANSCDVAEYCTGISPACPPDQVQPAGGQCRAASSECEAPGICTGSDSSCPAVSSLADGSRCSLGTCQAGSCRPESDLAITITASPNPASGVDPITYVVQVENRGPAPAQGVTVHLTVPPNTTIKSLGGDGWTCTVDGSNVTCSRGEVPFGNAPPLVMVVVPGYDQPSVTVTGNVTTTTLDPSMTNNTGTSLVNNDNPVHPRLAGGGLTTGCAVAPRNSRPETGAPLLIGLGLCVLALRRRRLARA